MDTVVLLTDTEENKNKTVKIHKFHIITSDNNLDTFAYLSH